MSAPRSPARRAERNGQGGKATRRQKSLSPCRLVTLFLYLLREGCSPMHFILNNWPLTFICAAMIVAAVIDGWKLKVPNWLTFPLIFSGWGLGLLHSFGLLESTGSGGIGASLLTTGLGFALL